MFLCCRSVHTRIDVIQVSVVNVNLRVWGGGAANTLELVLKSRVITLR